MPNNTTASDCKSCSSKGYFYSTTLGHTVALKCPRCDNAPPKGMDVLDLSKPYCKGVTTRKEPTDE